MSKLYEVIVAIELPSGDTTFERLEHRGRFAWRAKHIAEKHARNYRTARGRDAWVSEV